MLSNKQTRILLILHCIPILALISGCVGNHSKTSFYVLNSISGPSDSIHLPKNSGVIGIGPLRIPKYLDRPEIVTRYDRNGIRINEFHQWAGPLKDNVATVVKANLSLLLGTQNIVRYPWKRMAGVQFQIRINLQRLDVEDRLAVLSADWAIVDVESPSDTPSYRSNIEIPVSGDRYSDKVYAINKALSRFSLDLARSFAQYITNQTDISETTPLKNLGAATPKSGAPQNPAK